jgi:hypothetical protein
MRSRGRWLFIFLVTLSLPLLAVFALPPSFWLTLQIPAAMAIKRLGLSIGDSDTAMIVASVLVAWLSLAFPIAILSYVITSSRRAVRLVGVVGLIGVIVWLLVAGRSQRQRVYAGTYQHGFERSEFYPDGNCWRPPYWMDGFAPALHGFGNNSAVRVTFVGDATSLGAYGHLGAYLRRVQVSKVISVEPAQPCR